MGEVPEFAPDVLVEITDRNVAHALVGDGWACGLLGVRGIGARLNGRFKRMTWAQTRDKAFKPWGAWPCQSCVGWLRAGPNG